MSENNDKLKVTIQFNKKKVLLQEDGDSALLTYQKVLDVFRNPNENKESEVKSEITDYA